MVVNIKVKDKVREEQLTGTVLLQVLRWPVNILLSIRNQLSKLCLRLG